TSPRPFGESTTGAGTGGAAAAGATTGAVAASAVPSASAAEAAVATSRRRRRPGLGAGPGTLPGMDAVAGGPAGSVVRVIAAPSRDAAAVRSAPSAWRPHGADERPGVTGARSLRSVAERFRNLLQPYRGARAMSPPDALTARARGARAAYRRRARARAPAPQEEPPWGTSAAGRTSRGARRSPSGPWARPRSRSPPPPTATSCVGPP